MRVYDITVPVTSNIPVWPGDPKCKLIASKRISKGDECNLTHISMCAHTGTHIDAPCHFINGGDSVDKIPLENLIGSCVVVEMNMVDVIERSDLEQCNLRNQRRVLLKTKNSIFWESTKFQENFTYLGASAAEYIVEKEIGLIGIDYLSVDAFRSNEKQVHKTLLGKGIVILEGLNLTGITPGLYELICLPLKLLGSDGAPARVLLKEY